MMIKLWAWLIELIGFLRGKGRKELFWQWRRNGPRCLAFRPLSAALDLYHIFIRYCCWDAAAVYNSYSLLLNRSLACKHHYSNFLFESFVGRCTACALLCTDCSPPLQAIAILSVPKYRSFSFYPKSNFSNFDKVYRKIYLYLQHISSWFNKIK